MSHGRLFTISALVSLGSAALGCTGSIGEQGGLAGTDGPGSEISCADGPSAARTPIRRMTVAEYRATVRDVLRIPAPSLDGFITDEIRGGFDVNMSAPSELAVEKLRATAEELAATAREGFADVCDVAETDCVRDYLASLGLRAFRRPLEAEELDDYVAMVEAERETSDAETALELAVQTILMSPSFVYHVEIGRPVEGDASVAKLTGYEVAARLSYFLWGTIPDETLFGEAAAGALDTPEGIETAARRMLGDARARDMIVQLARQWLDLRAIDDVVRDEATFPDWDPSLVQSMRTETETFLEEVLLHGDGKLETLLTAPYSYVDGPLAAHYGVDGGEPGTFDKTVLPDGERAGLLTQGVILVTHAYPTRNSWVHRGKFVRERMLCGSLPPPPANVDFGGGNDPNRLTNPECSGCHLQMDTIGKAFDTYDPTGRFATLDATGAPIDPTGEVVASDIGKFDSVVALASELAADPQVHACFADTFATYALGRGLGDDPCAREAILAEFEASGHDLRTLFVAIAKSDAFRFTRID